MGQGAASSVGAEQQVATVGVISEARCKQGGMKPLSFFQQRRIAHTKRCGGMDAMEMEMLPRIKHIYIFNI